jgi:beta-lactam-binding protein with PASTA domain
MTQVGVLVLVLAGCQFSTSAGGTLRRGGGGGTANGESTTVTMPDLFQLTRAQADAAIHEAGITGELEIETNHGTCGSVVDHHVVELGHVCRQTPAAGNQTSSRLFVAIQLQDENPWHGELGGGRRWFLLPDLAGMTTDQARDKLHALGFTAGDHLRVSYVDEPGCKPNIVCRTYPEAMTRTDNTSDKLLFAGRPLDGPSARHDTPDVHAAHDGKASPPPAQKKSDLGDLF